MVMANAQALMMRELVLRIPLSFPAKAGNPVRRGLSIESLLSRRTRSPDQVFSPGT
ncbi:protein of unknown function [Bradyrhizobium vignae]|uniref:Uncharacterized protein n=1 Tax=Bradyrhizobium vignae TaxID=1549949 RepID=A0A2U3PYN9_9BRAD|nr:protein of unknown function [Bradyrhizobium vignae]